MSLAPASSKRENGDMPGKESEWFRYACVTVVAAVCLPPIAEALAVLSSKLPAGHRQNGEALFGLVVSGAVALLVTAIFAWACWVVTRPRETAGPGVHILLGLQLLGCAGLTIELVHLVSVQVGATLPWRSAWRWQATISGLVLTISVLAVLDKSFEPSSGLSHLPWTWQVVATTVSVLTWNLFAFLAGRLIVAERERRQQLAFTNGELRATRRLLDQTARVSERLRIARDLHDTLGHHLTAMVVNLELAGRVPPAEAPRIVERSLVLSKLLLSDVRETVQEMRSSQSVDLAASLQEMAASVATQRVHLDLDTPYAMEDAEAAQTLLRCAQEALTNAMRHSDARQIWIELRETESGHSLAVRDDGRGSKNLVPGNGLRGMRERLETLGGTLSVAGVPGFEVRAMIPRREARV